MIELADDLLRGSYPPLVTPFRDDRVDYDAYAQLIEFQIAHGSHGIVVAGTTGEPTCLTAEERQRLLEVAVDAAAGRVPVVAATGSQSLAETRLLTEHATRCGASAVLVLTPYFVRPPVRGLVRYFVDLGCRTELPMLVYHIPGRAGVSVDVEGLAAIAAEVPHFVGIKHAANDLGLVSDALGALGDRFRVLVGLEELSFPMLAIGASGLVNAVANIAPAKVAQLAEAMRRDDVATGRRLHFELLGLNRAVFWDTNPIPIKYLMRRMGLLATNEHRLPMAPATPELEARLDALAERTGLLQSAV